jgi:transcriptional regulator EpsA
MGPLLGYLRDCWVAAQHAPCEVELIECEPLLRDCTAAQRQALRGMHTAVVHGTMNRARGAQRIFAALTSDPNPPAGSGAALKLLLPFMDSAVGRISVPGAHPATHAEECGAATTALGVLSERELEIMQWVALGKTNPEIGCILGISEFTVKNHMKSIFGKLDVANRAQAVAKLTKLGAHA